MWSLKAPAAVLGLVAATLLPTASAKPYPVHVQGFEAPYNASQVEKRDCASPCGWYNQLCCTSGQQCITNANNEAECAAGGGQTGEWQYMTTVITRTDLQTITSIWSTYVPATADAQPTATCGQSQSPCGGKCCDSGYWCQTSGQCALIGGGSSGGIIGTLTPSAPLRPTSSTLIIVTATGSPTATVPFQTPIATGVDGEPVQTGGGGGGLSGGAIAGIVIGTILGLLLLLLICFFCCARALFDSILAIFGLGKKKRHTHEETYIEEHHHSSGGGGRRWYGQGPARPSRPPKSSGGGMGNMLGLGAALGGLALALGLKRRHDKRHDDKSTTISGSSYMYSSDYTSSSES